MSHCSSQPDQLQQPDSQPVIQPTSKQASILPASESAIQTSDSQPAISQQGGRRQRRSLKIGRGAKFTFVLAQRDRCLFKVKLPFKVT